MKFELNNTKWIIRFSNKNWLLKKYNKEHKEKATFVFGLCDYTKHIININSELEETQILQTLRHELAHCWLWTFGAVYDNYTEEELCNKFASMCEFVYEVSKEFKNSRLKCGIYKEME